jgi:energy-coupling factor transport system substrate-specific component
MIRQTSIASIFLYLLTTLIGVTAFLYPFFLPELSQLEGFAAAAHANDAPLLLGGLTVICVGVLLIEAQGVSSNARFVALLAILVAFNSALRFLEVALPGPGGFTPIFFLIALGGYVYGAPFGFLLGALTLLVSAFITGGVGPWLPYQMITAGWVGLTAPICRPFVNLLKGEGRRREIFILTLFGVTWGFLYGVIINIWFWPYSTGAATMYWQPGIGWRETLARYTVFYIATSAWWDLFGAMGNGFLMATFGLPVVRVLRRFRHRFEMQMPEGTSAPLAPRLSFRTLLPEWGNRFGWGRARTSQPAVVAPTIDAPMPPALWVVWTGVLVLWLSLTRNPFYLLLIALLIIAIRLMVPRNPAAPYAVPFRLLPLALLIIPMAGVLNALFTHFGDTVLFRLPSEWLLIGGAITLEAFIYGAVTGFALVLMLATFTVLHHVLNPAALVGLLPRAFRPVGVVIVIALAFVPSLRRHAQQVREAQAVRGHEPKGWRDMLPLLLPLLIGGLEHAIQLAEAMTARGFGAQQQSLPPTARWSMVAGLGLLFGGWWWWLLGGGILAQTLIVLGALLIVACLWALGRLQSYTAYRHYRWRRRDVGILVILLVALVPVVARELSLFYYPYPRLSLPPLDALTLLSLLGLLAPMVPFLTAPRRGTIAPTLVSEPTTDVRHF